MSCNSASRKNYPAWASIVRCANRAMLARISSVDFVQTNGRPVALCAARNSRIARSSATTLRKMPRRWRLTDEQLALLWQAEFPNSRTRYTMKSVPTVRSLFNLGRRNNDRPRTPIPQYD